MLIEFFFESWAIYSEQVDRIKAGASKLDASFHYFCNNYDKIIESILSAPQVAMANATPVQNGRSSNPSGPWLYQKFDGRADSDSGSVNYRGIGECREALDGELTNKQDDAILLEKYLTLENNRNKDLVGKTHPKTNVPFVEKFIQVDGKDYKVIAPEFRSYGTISLEPSKYMASTSTQKSLSSKLLYEKLQNDPKLKAEFTEQEIKLLKEGRTPPGKTWHHEVEIGQMSLVDRVNHKYTGHTGGFYIWGFGSKKWRNQHFEK